jgi:hypothetical protein
LALVNGIVRVGGRQARLCKRTWPDFLLRQLYHGRRQSNWPPPTPEFSTTSVHARFVERRRAERRKFQGFKPEKMYSRVPTICFRHQKLEYDRDSSSVSSTEAMALIPGCALALPARVFRLATSPTFSKLSRVGFPFSAHH